MYLWEVHVYLKWTIDDTSSLDGTAATNISNELDIHLDLYDTNVIGTFMVKILKLAIFLKKKLNP